MSLAKKDSSHLAQRRVLLTGATGLVGGFVAQELIERSAHIIAIVRDDVVGSYFETSGLMKQCTIVRGDIKDFSLVQRVVNEYQIEGVIHLAAQTQVRVANEHPVATFESNITGTWNILEAVRQSVSNHVVSGAAERLQFIVIASSDKAYGEPLTDSYTEDHPLLAQYPYDVSKACADMIARSYAATYKLPVSVTRCGNFFGPGDLNWDRLIPHVIQSFLRGQKPVIRSSGELVRDYFYVKDGAKAYVFLAEKICEAKKSGKSDRSLAGEVFNFSYGQSYSVMEVVSMLTAMMDCRQLEPEILNQAPMEILKQNLSSEKVRKVLGWQPSYTMESGLCETIAWYTEHNKNRSSAV